MSTFSKVLIQYYHQIDLSQFLLNQQQIKSAAALLDLVFGSVSRE
jgi:hypothetical protein